MDKKFFSPSCSLSIKEIIDLTGAETDSELDQDFDIKDVAPLERATSDEITFIKSRKSLELLNITGSRAIFSSRGLASKFPSHIIPLIVQDPQTAFVKVTEHLYPDTVKRSTSTGKSTGISKRASIDGSAQLEDGVSIDENVVIGPDVEIGSGTVIGPNTTIGRGCKIGRNCYIASNVTIEFSLIGNNVSIFAGVSLGQDGFGYVSTKTHHIKVPQIGRLIIQNDVEIGANSTIDRGALDDTVIGEGTKIDNLVQIGHNVKIGRHCIIVSQVGIAGSTTLGDFVVLGGNVGVNGHITVGDRAQIAAKSAVPSDVPEGARWGGIPARPMKAFLRDVAEINARAFGRGKRKNHGEQSD